MSAHHIVIEPAESKITLTCKGEAITQTQRALKLQEPPIMPVYYTPRDDVAEIKDLPVLYDSVVGVRKD